MPEHTSRSAECAACGKFFSSDDVFSRHRVGSYERDGQASTRHCLSGQEMEAKGWRKNAHDHWERGRFDHRAASRLAEVAGQRRKARQARRAGTPSESGMIEDRATDGEVSREC